MTTTRRDLFSLATGVASLLAAGPAAARWDNTVRYPDPTFEILDPSFAKYRLDAGGVERLWTGPAGARAPSGWPISAV